MTDATNLFSMAHVKIIFVQATAYSVCIFQRNATEQKGNQLYKRFSDISFSVELQNPNH